jgi:hypothetical protein
MVSTFAALISTSCWAGWKPQRVANLKNRGAAFSNCERTWI